MILENLLFDNGYFLIDGVSYKYISIELIDDVSVHIVMQDKIICYVFDEMTINDIKYHNYNELLDFFKPFLQSNN